MYTGSLGATSNQEDFVRSFATVDGSNNPLSIAGAAMVLFITDPDVPTNAIISGSVQDRTIVISGDGLSFSWTIPATTMAKLLAGTYALFLRMTLNGVITQLISGTVSVGDGGPTS